MHSRFEMHDGCGVGMFNEYFKVLKWVGMHYMQLGEWWGFASIELDKFISGIITEYS